MSLTIPSKQYTNLSLYILTSILRVSLNKRGTEYFILHRIFPSNVWMTLHYITKYQTKWLLFYARYTLYDFGLFQTKGDQHETIVVISFIVAPKQLSYVMLWFKDGCCHRLTTKDNLRNCPDGVRNLGWPSHSVLLWPTSTDQPIKMHHKMTYYSMRHGAKA